MWSVCQTNVMKVTWRRSAYLVTFDLFHVATVDQYCVGGVEQEVVRAIDVMFVDKFSLVLEEVCSGPSLPA